MFKTAVVIFLGALIALGKCQIGGDDLIVDAGILGLIRGTPANSSSDLGVRREYMQFRGIPYATITQRFRPSTLKEEELAPGSMFNATAPGLSCFQPFLPPVLLTEDCLWINVYTHKKFSGDETELRPVLFFVHGGAFTIGTGHQFSGLRLMNRDIVYVNFNYRLGLMGFFSLENEDAPGNAAMYDIVNALQWTRNHIRAFGGDPDRITIAGQSAGSVAVTQLMASPMAQGMFHGAIAASGSALNAWGTSTNPMPESLRIANMTGCHNLDNTTPDLALIALCMRTADPVLLVDTLMAYQVAERRAGRLGFSVVSPIVQNFDTGSLEKFLPEHPRTVFQRGNQSNVPLIMGATKHDGSYVLGVVYNRFLKDNGLVDNSTFLRYDLVPTLLRALGVEDVPYGIHEVIAQTYLGDARNSGDFMSMYPGLMDIFSVFFFKGDCYQTAKHHTSVNDTFWYSFDYEGSVSLFNSLYPGEGERPPFPGGVAHTDDLIYVFALTFLEFEPQEAIVSSRMLNYWADFVTTGNPTPPESSETIWPLLTTDVEEYLIIDSESASALKYPDSWVGPGQETVPTPLPDNVVDAGILGFIRGAPGNTAEENGTRTPYLQFRGIPYATIPERFLPSVLFEENLAYGDVFNATAPGPGCFQPLLPPEFFSEDCLTMNVYTHKKFSGNESELRPVIFFIHGGAFTVGTGSQFSALRMLNRDVVYVSFNYRLGLFGYYSLSNENIPGNAGMYDVVNALKWTNNHIRAFGGDPTRITIAGQSAGAVTVTQLMASPMAQGLFHRAIAASGSALNAWGTSTNPMRDSLTIANMTGCHDLENTSPDLAAIATCMRAADPSTLVDVLWAYQVAERRGGRLGFSVVSPVLQDYEMGTMEKFLPEHPRTVFQEGRQSDVPLMMGTTKHDGSYVLGVVYNRFIKDNGLADNSTFLRYDLVPTMLRALGVEDVPFGIHEIIAQTYMGDARNSGDFMSMYPGLMDIFSVFFFKGDCYQTAKLHARKSDTFWYSFEFVGQASLFNSLFPGEGERPPFPGGVTHTDDMIYLFSLTFLEFTPEDSQMSTMMLDYWENFAAFGNPTPAAPIESMQTWPLLSLDQEQYLKIDAIPSEGVRYEDSWVGAGLDTLPEVPTGATDSPSSTEATTPTATDTTPSGTPDTTSPNTDQTTPPASAPTTPPNSSNSVKVSTIFITFTLLIAFIAKL